MLYLVLIHFIVDLAQKWLREKTFYYILLHFIVDFARAAWLWEQIFDFIFLFSIDFARLLHTPVTVEADILSCLIVLYNWFSKRTAEEDFLGSCRKYILSLISYVTCWRSTETLFFFKYCNIFCLRMCKFLEMNTSYQEKNPIKEMNEQQARSQDVRDFPSWRRKPLVHGTVKQLWIPWKCCCNKFGRKFGRTRNK